MENEVINIDDESDERPAKRARVEQVPLKGAAISYRP
jgi:hypothetical protein